MNLNLKFENANYEKRIHWAFIASAVCLILGISAIVFMVLTRHYSEQLNDSTEKATLISVNMSEEINSVSNSLSIIATLISDNNMKTYISPKQVSSLLNDIISGNDTIYGAFTLLNKTEFEDIEKMTASLPEISSQDEMLELINSIDKDNVSSEEKNVIISSEDNITEGVNKLIYKSAGSTYETNLDRINNTEYKKNYISVLLSKKPQMMKPFTNIYDGVEVTTCTYSVPILDGDAIEGVIGVDIDIEALCEQIKNNKNLSSGTFMVTDKEGNVLTSNDKSLSLRNISDIYQGMNNSDTLKFLSENMTSGTTNLFKHKTLDLLTDDLFVITPVVINDTHVWNLISVSPVDRIVSNSLATILFVTIMNFCLFSFFLLIIWKTFGKMIQDKFDSLFNKVELELSNIKARSSQILEDIEDIEDITITEIDEPIENEVEEIIEEDITDEIMNSDFGKELEKVDVTPKDDANIEKAIAETNADSVGVPTIDDIIEEEKGKEEAEEKEETNEEQASEIEEPAEPVETEDVEEAEEESSDDSEDDEDEDESSEDDAPDIDLSKPLEGANGKPVSALEQLEAQGIGQKVSQDELDEVISNKDGISVDEDLMAEAEAKMAKAMGEDVPEPAIVEAPKAEEPKVEEPKAEEPKAEAPKAKPVAPAAVSKPEPSPEEEKPKKEEKDYYEVKLTKDDMEENVPRRDRKLTNREMDDLLKELEEKRRRENEEMGIVEDITNDFSNETTIDPNDIKDLVSKIGAED